MGPGFRRDDDKTGTPNVKWPDAATQIAILSLSGKVAMPMAIVRCGDKYGAVRSGQNYQPHYWSSDGLISREQLIQELLSQGAHQQDIGDLLDELDADPRRFCAIM
jgi:hypothetical protein